MAEEKQNQEQKEQEELNKTEAEAAETAEAEEAAPKADEQTEENQTELLEKQLKELQERLEEKENKLLRVQADFENYKRRARLDLEAAEKYRSQRIISDLLRRSTILIALSGSSLTMSRRKACFKGWKWCTAKSLRLLKMKVLKKSLPSASSLTRTFTRP